MMHKEQSGNTKGDTDDWMFQPSFLFRASSSYSLLLEMRLSSHIFSYWDANWSPTGGSAVFGANGAAQWRNLAEVLEWCGHPPSPQTTYTP